MPDTVRLMFGFSDLLKDNLVVVEQLLSVRLIEGFVGICIAFFPQYFTNAILEGLSQVTTPSSGKLCVLLHL